MIGSPLSADLAALEQRYSVFIEKLATRGAQLVAETLPRIKQLVSSPADSDAGVVDLAKMAFNRQLASLNDKAYQVYNNQILHAGGVGPSDPGVYEFREACYARFASLEALIRQWRDEVDEAIRPDYESELKSIQQQFETDKGTYRCGRCGAPVPVERIFFSDIYVTCPQCGAQNHFAPSAGARRLDFIARPLAERRHAAKLSASHVPRQQTALLEEQWHARITPAKAGDPAAKAECRQLCEQMVALNAEAEQQVRGYLNAVYTDMTELVPDQVALYQKQYQQDADTYLAGVVADRARIDQMIQQTRPLIQPDGVYVRQGSYDNRV